MKPVHTVIFSILVLGAILAVEKGLSQEKAEKAISEPAEKLYVSVKDFGAKGDGKTDDTEAIQKAFDAAAFKSQTNNLEVAKCYVKFPQGHYRITKAIRLGKQHRLVLIEGTGGVDTFGGMLDIKRSPPGATQIIYDGEEGGYIFDVWGVGGLEMKNISLIGNNKAKVLLRINSPKGAGGGRYMLQRVKFGYADTGIETGDDSYINSADMSFYDVMFRKLKTGFKTNSGQNIDYAFIRPHALQTDTVFHFRKGGNAYAAMSTNVNCGLIVRIDTGGINAGSFQFANLHSETSTGKAYQILKASGETQVVFTGLNMQTARKAREKGDTSPLFTLSKGAHAVVIGGMFGNGPVAKIKGDERHPVTWMQCNNCRFRGPDYLPDPRKEKYLTTEGNAGFEMKNSTVGKEFVQEFTILPKKQNDKAAE